MSEFRKYTREELVKFLRSMDGVLEDTTEILVIGGAAAALKYGATASTKDIDTWHTVPLALLKAASAARAETGLAVPIEKAGVSDGPYHYEDRVRPVSMRLKKLRILVPDRHDLALMKVVRGDRHDEDIIAEIHARHPLKLDVLLMRFEEEMGHVTKDERILRWQFRALVSRLFGTQAARRVPFKRKSGAGGTRV
ncbi:MAG: DUF6036 family nucleotidyltransferase [Polyangia bacterium]